MAGHHPVAASAAAAPALRSAPATSAASVSGAVVSVGLWRVSGPVRGRAGSVGCCGSGHAAAPAADGLQDAQPLVADLYAKII